MTRITRENALALIRDGRLHVGSMVRVSGTGRSDVEGAYEVDQVDRHDPGVPIRVMTPVSGPQWRSVTGREVYLLDEPQNTSPTLRDALTDAAREASDEQLHTAIRALGYEVIAKTSYTLTKLPAS